jgi:hypothetical protein
MIQLYGPSYRLAQLSGAISALGLSGSGSCGSGLAGSGDIDHVRVIQPVAGPDRPYAPRGLEPTTDVVFCGNAFPIVLQMQPGNRAG